MSNEPSTATGSASATGDAMAPSHATDQHNRLATFFEIAKIPLTEHDLETMLQKFLRCLVETIPAADAGVLMLHDPADGMLKVKASLGFDPALVNQIRLAPGESMTGKAFESGQAQLYASREATEAAMSSMRPENRRLFLGATVGLRESLGAVCVPLQTGEKKIGVLVLENLHNSGSFTDADLGFLQHVADLMTVSLENAALKDQLQAVQALSEANRLKAELISTLAHEMRTPLTSIKGYSTALLMDEADFSPETQREFLNIIDEECDILQDLIHDLLESSIIDAGFLKLELEPVVLPRLVRGVVDDIARRHEEHRFLIDFPDQFPIVDADPHRVIQVLRNLLDNAVKYSHAGGLVVVRGEEDEHEVVISVADQGVGIAPEHLNRLFEKYFRIKTGLGQHVVGAGLGLPIARTIVENHGGRIWAESRVGQGTTMYFTLPKSNSADETEEGGD